MIPVENKPLGLLRVIIYTQVKAPNRPVATAEGFELTWADPGSEGQINRCEVFSSVSV